MNTIYKPKGAAAEYGDYAVNIYTGSPLLFRAPGPPPGAGGISLLRVAAQRYCPGVEETAEAEGRKQDRDLH